MPARADVPADATHRGRPLQPKLEEEEHQRARHVDLGNDDGRGIVLRRGLGQPQLGRIQRDLRLGQRFADRALRRRELRRARRERQPGLGELVFQVGHVQLSKAMQNLGL